MKATEQRKQTKIHRLQNREIGQMPPKDEDSKYHGKN